MNRSAKGSGILRGLALIVVAAIIPACSDGSTGPQGPPGPPGSAVTSLTAGDGIVATPNPIVSTGTLAVNFAGPGSATTVSRTDHHHDAAYLQLTGGTLTGALTVGGVLSGDGSGLSSLNASNLGSGTIPDSRLGGSYTSGVTLSNTTNSFTGTFTLGAPATRTVSISSAAFRPLDNTTVFSGFPGLFVPAGNTGTFLASVQLPEGSGITQIVATVLDNSILAGANVVLLRVPDVDGTLEVVAVGNTSVGGASATPQPVTLTPVGAFTFPLAVENTTHSYALLFQVTNPNAGDLVKFFKARIDYQVATPLP
jgi:hypothetical protein